MTSIDTISSSPSVYPQKPCLSCFAGVNDVLMRIAVTGILFFWLGLIFMILFAILFESLFDIHDGYWFIATPLIASLLTTGVCVCFLNRFTWRKHALSEQKERRFSMLIGAYWGYFLTVIYLFIFPYKLYMIIGLFVLLPLMGKDIGARFPIYGCSKLWRRFVCALVFWFLAFPFLWLLAQFVPSRPISYSGEHFPRGLSTFFFHDYALMTRGIIPDGVTDIYIKGKGGSQDFATYHWSCRMTESDFLSFAKEKNYTLTKNSADYTEGMICIKLRPEPPGPRELGTLHGVLPTHYWCYRNSNRILLYDCTTGILHGCYHFDL